MDAARTVTPGRLRRLADELADEQLGVLERSSNPDVLLDELDYALRPPRHERRIASYGALVLPSAEVVDWEAGTGLRVTVSAAVDRADDEVRRYADGVSSWAVRRAEGIESLIVFDRPVSSERDLVVVADATGAMVVQRHPNGSVRVVGSFGVARFDGIGWHLEPPAARWFQPSVCSLDDASPMGHELVETVTTLLRFAVHDLGARGIGATFVVGPQRSDDAAFERRMPPPPRLSIRFPPALGPLRHVLSQLDGAALVDVDGIVRELGVRIAPSPWAESTVAAIGGTRHTSARRYSADDPGAIVVVVSEAGPVTVFKAGEIVGRSLGE